MFKHNIIITEFNALYQILFEINDFLKFNLKKTSLNDIDKIDPTSSIILSKFIYKDELIKKINPNRIIFFLESKESIKNINDYKYILNPFNINNLVEKINVQLLKKKFNDQSFVKILNYTLDLNSRIISNDKDSLKLTEKEINIILFLNKNKKPQKVTILQNEVWGYHTELETHTVETHIYRLRKKISVKFKDNNFIKSQNNGYLIS
ncbi:winged helix-turn-helix domain-containing protein [Candidatus Pelagibacter sp.]|mgnify:CR=1 FL=1|jgi:hypothetical protein|nr:winged helix-turn-helix domain-containing protein [Candidatus Pelagibacter sp.]|tara:strand:+ start:277 stop:897 length:621 start_codon:yes stop_codon:yes gene_type:complete